MEKTWFEFDYPDADTCWEFFSFLRKEFPEIIMRKLLAVEKAELNPLLLDYCKQHSIKFVSRSYNESTHSYVLIVVNPTE